MSHFSFFQHVLKNYDGNIFEKTLPEMNAEHQFKMVRCIIFNITSHSRFGVEWEENINDPESGWCENYDENKPSVFIQTVTMRINLVSLFSNYLNMR